MKKWLGIILLGVVFVLAGCKSYVTPENLKANDWLVEPSKAEKEKGTPNMIVSFSDHVMSIKVDTSSLESSAEDGWEALGEEIGKQLVEQLNFKFEYEINKDELKLTDTEDNSKIFYKVTKDDDNVIFTPDKEKNTDEDEGNKMVLQPYKKTKTKSSSTASSSTTETTTSSTKEKEVASTDDYIKKFEDKSLVVYNKRKMTKDDFGMAPMTAKDAAIFSLIETDNEDEQKNARILTFDNLEDLNATKAYYDDLGKSSAALFSYTAVDEDNLVLMQFNGGLDQALVEQYTESASLKLTEPPFDTTSSSSEGETTVQESYTPQVAAEPASSSAEEPQPTEPSSSQVTQAAETPVSSEQETSKDGDYTLVQSGEGPNQIAARTGVSVDTIFALNGLDPNNYMMYPGMQIRIR
ncbi:LysM peptidoglycan-binding domain-containing protein [Enterococcus sp. 2201sp1_2201st1_B8_2201SCRN_220225]|uniref:LysM peptidoglycan-binding domain-containing protein n=1 Tax=unclassified Enterococcus TaxID=2608891 RepID=UPI0034A1FE2D